jgi:SPP1 family holin
MEETTKVTSGTIARTIILAISLINMILTSFGHSIIPISDETVTTVVADLFAIVMSVITWWKNNSFTKAAISADEVMNELKSK